MAHHWSRRLCLFRTHPPTHSPTHPAEPAAAELRQQYLSAAAALTPARQQRRRQAAYAVKAAAVGGPGSSGSSSGLAERHAVVLGLRAFVLSSPYDVPPWLPDVLMALVPLAAEPPPLRWVMEAGGGGGAKTERLVWLAGAGL